MINKNHRTGIRFTHISEWRIIWFFQYVVITTMNTRTQQLSLKLNKLTIQKVKSVAKSAINWREVFMIYFNRRSTVKHWSVVSEVASWTYNKWQEGFSRPAVGQRDTVLDRWRQTVEWHTQPHVLLTEGVRELNSSLTIALTN